MTLREELGESQQSLKIAQAILDEIYSLSPIPYLTINGVGKIERLNGAAEAFLGSNASPHADDNFAQRIAPHQQPLWHDRLTRLATPGSESRVDLDLFLQPKSKPSVSAHLRCVRLSYPEVTTQTSILIAITDRTEHDRTATELRIAAIAFESQQSIFITDDKGVILRINAAFSKLTGYSSGEILGKSPRLLNSGRHDAEFYKSIWASVRETGAWQGEIWDRHKNGDVFPAWINITAVKDGGGNVTHHVATLHDITGRKTFDSHLQHLAHYDALTDLPNRALLTDRLHQALAQVRRDKGMLAVMFLDLDHFKPVNDTLGHAVGDLLLKDVARRLGDCVRRDSDTVSRFGGDEFVVLLPLIEGTEDAKRVAEKIVENLGRPFKIAPHSIDISASVGIAIYPTHGDDAASLMKHADIAMYAAKQNGRNGYRLFSPAMNAPTAT